MTIERMTIKECQGVYDRYGIDSYEHNVLTTDLCMVIAEQERALQDALIALNQVPNTKISGKFGKTYEVCSMLEKVLRRKPGGKDNG